MIATGEEERGEDGLRGGRVDRITGGRVGRCGGCIDRIALVHVRPGIAAHVDEVTHVVLHHASHGERAALPHGVADGVLVVEANRVADAHPEQARGLLGQVDVVRPEMQVLLRDAVLEGHGVPKTRGVLRDEHGDA